MDKAPKRRNGSAQALRVASVYHQPMVQIPRVVSCSGGESKSRRRLHSSKRTRSHGSTSRLGSHPQKNHTFVNQRLRSLEQSILPDLGPSRRPEPGASAPSLWEDVPSQSSNAAQDPNFDYSSTPALSASFFRVLVGAGSRTPRTPSRHDPASRSAVWTPPQRSSGAPRSPAPNKSAYLPLRTSTAPVSDSGSGTRLPLLGASSRSQAAVATTRRSPLPEHARSTSAGRLNELAQTYNTPSQSTRTLTAGGTRASTGLLAAVDHRPLTTHIVNTGPLEDVSGAAVAVPTRDWLLSRFPKVRPEVLPDHVTAHLPLVVTVTSKADGDSEVEGVRAPTHPMSPFLGHLWQVTSLLHAVTTPHPPPPVLETPFPAEQKSKRAGSLGESWVAALSWVDRLYDPLSFSTEQIKRFEAACLRLMLLGSYEADRAVPLPEEFSTFLSEHACRQLLAVIGLLNPPFTRSHNDAKQAEGVPQSEPILRFALSLVERLSLCHWRSAYQCEELADEISQQVGMHDTSSGTQQAVYNARVARLMKNRVLGADNRYEVLAREYAAYCRELPSLVTSGKRMAPKQPAPNGKHVIRRRKAQPRKPAFAVHGLARYVFCSEDERAMAGKARFRAGPASPQAQRGRQKVFSTGSQSTGNLEQGRAAAACLSAYRVRRREFELACPILSAGFAKWQQQARKTVVAGDARAEGEDYSSLFEGNSHFTSHVRRQMRAVHAQLKPVLLFTAVQYGRLGPLAVALMSLACSTIKSSLALSEMLAVTRPAVSTEWAASATFSRDEVKQEDFQTGTLLRYAARDGAVIFSLGDVSALLCAVETAFIRDIVSPLLRGLSISDGCEDVLLCAVELFFRAHERIQMENEVNSSRTENSEPRAVAEILKHLHRLSSAERLLMGAVLYSERVRRKIPSAGEGGELCDEAALIAPLAGFMWFDLGSDWTTESSEDAPLDSPRKAPSSGIDLTIEVPDGAEDNDEPGFSDYMIPPFVRDELTFKQLNVDAVVAPVLGFMAFECGALHQFIGECLLHVCQACALSVPLYMYISQPSDIASLLLSWMCYGVDGAQLREESRVLGMYVRPRNLVSKMSDVDMSIPDSVRYAGPLGILSCGRWPVVELERLSEYQTPKSDRHFPSSLPPASPDSKTYRVAQKDTKDGLSTKLRICDTVMVAKLLPQASRNAARVFRRYGRVPGLLPSSAGGASATQVPGDKSAFWASHSLVKSRAARHNLLVCETDRIYTNEGFFKLGKRLLSMTGIAEIQGKQRSQYEGTVTLTLTSQQVDLIISVACHGLPLGDESKSSCGSCAYGHVVPTASSGQPARPHTLNVTPGQVAVSMLSCITRRIAKPLDSFRDLLVHMQGCNFLLRRSVSWVRLADCIRHESHSALGMLEPELEPSLAHHAVLNTRRYVVQYVFSMCGISCHFVVKKLAARLRKRGETLGALTVGEFLVQIKSLYVRSCVKQLQSFALYAYVIALMIHCSNRYRLLPYLLTVSQEIREKFQKCAVLIQSAANIDYTSLWESRWRVPRYSARKQPSKSRSSYNRRNRSRKKIYFGVPICAIFKRIANLDHQPAVADAESGVPSPRMSCARPCGVVSECEVLRFDSLAMLLRVPARELASDLPAGFPAPEIPDHGASRQHSAPSRRRPDRNLTCRYREWSDLFAPSSAGGGRHSVDGEVSINFDKFMQSSPLQVPSASSPALSASLLSQFQPFDPQSREQQLDAGEAGDHLTAGGKSNQKQAEALAVGLHGTLATAGQDLPHISLQFLEAIGLQRSSRSHAKRNAWRDDMASIQRASTFSVVSPRYGQLALYGFSQKSDGTEVGGQAGERKRPIIRSQTTKLSAEARGEDWWLSVHYRSNLRQQASQSLTPSHQHTAKNHAGLVLSGSRKHSIFGPMTSSECFTKLLFGEKWARESTQKQGNKTAKSGRKHAHETSMQSRLRGVLHCDACRATPALSTVHASELWVLLQECDYNLVALLSVMSHLGDAGIAVMCVHSLGRVIRSIKWAGAHRALWIERAFQNRLVHYDNEMSAEDALRAFDPFLTSNRICQCTLEHEALPIDECRSEVCAAYALSRISEKFWWFVWGWPCRDIFDNRQQIAREVALWQREKRWTALTVGGGRETRVSLLLLCGDAVFKEPGHASEEAAIATVVLFGLPSQWKSVRSPSSQRRGLGSRQHSSETTTLTREAKDKQVTNAQDSDSDQSSQESKSVLQQARIRKRRTFIQKQREKWRREREEEELAREARERESMRLADQLKREQDAYRKQVHEFSERVEMQAVVRSRRVNLLEKKEEARLEHEAEVQELKQMEQREQQRMDREARKMGGVDDVMVLLNVLEVDGGLDEYAGADGQPSMSKLLTQVEPDRKDSIDYAAPLHREQLRKLNKLFNCPTMSFSYDFQRSLIFDRMPLFDRETMSGLAAFQLPGVSMPCDWFRVRTAAYSRDLTLHFQSEDSEPYGPVQLFSPDVTDALTYLCLSGAARSSSLSFFDHPTHIVAVTESVSQPAQALFNWVAEHVDRRGLSVLRVGLASQESDEDSSSMDGMSHATGRLSVATAATETERERVGFGSGVVSMDVVRPAQIMQDRRMLSAPLVTVMLDVLNHPNVPALQVKPASMIYKLLAQCDRVISSVRSPTNRDRNSSSPVLADCSLSMTAGGELQLCVTGRVVLRLPAGFTRALFDAGSRDQPRAREHRLHRRRSRQTPRKRNALKNRFYYPNPALAGGDEEKRLIGDSADGLEPETTELFSPRAGGRSTPSGSRPGSRSNLPPTLLLMSYSRKRGSTRHSRNSSGRSSGRLQEESDFRADTMDFEDSQFLSQSMGDRGHSAAQTPTDNNRSPSRGSPELSGQGASIFAPLSPAARFGRVRTMGVRRSSGRMGRRSPAPMSTKHSVAPAAAKPRRRLRSHQSVVAASSGSGITAVRRRKRLGRHNSARRSNGVGAPSGMSMTGLAGGVDISDLQPKRPKKGLRRHHSGQLADTTPKVHRAFTFQPMARGEDSLESSMASGGTSGRIDMFGSPQGSPSGGIGMARVLGTAYEDPPPRGFLYPLLVPTLQGHIHYVHHFSGIPLGWTLAMPLCSAPSIAKMAQASLGQQMSALSARVHASRGAFSLLSVLQVLVEGRLLNALSLDSGSPCLTASSLLALATGFGLKGQISEEQGNLQDAAREHKGPMKAWSAAEGRALAGLLSGAGQVDYCAAVKAVFPGWQSAYNSSKSPRSPQNSVHFRRVKQNVGALLNRNSGRAPLGIQARDDSGELVSSGTGGARTSARNSVAGTTKFRRSRSVRRLRSTVSSAERAGSPEDLAKFLMSKSKQLPETPSSKGTRASPDPAGSPIRVNSRDQGSLGSPSAASPPRKMSAGQVLDILDAHRVRGSLEDMGSSELLRRRIRTGLLHSVLHPYRKAMNRAMHSLAGDVAGFSENMKRALGTYSVPVGAAILRIFSRLGVSFPSLDELQLTVQLVARMVRLKCHEMMHHPAQPTISSLFVSASEEHQLSSLWRAASWSTRLCHGMQVLVRELGRLTVVTVADSQYAREVADKCPVDSLRKWYTAFDAGLIHEMKACSTCVSVPSVIETRMLREEDMVFVPVPMMSFLSSLEAVIHTLEEIVGLMSSGSSADLREARRSTLFMFPVSECRASSRTHSSIPGSPGGRRQSSRGPNSPHGSPTTSRRGVDSSPVRRFSGLFSAKRFDPMRQLPLPRWVLCPGVAVRGMDATAAGQPLSRPVAGVWKSYEGQFPLIPPSLQFSQHMAALAREGNSAGVGVPDAHIMLLPVIAVHMMGMLEGWVNWTHRPGGSASKPAPRSASNTLRARRMPSRASSGVSALEIARMAPRSKASSDAQQKRRVGSDEYMAAYGSRVFEEREVLYRWCLSYLFRRLCMDASSALQRRTNAGIFLSSFDEAAGSDYDLADVWGANVIRAASRRPFVRTPLSLTLIGLFQTVRWQPTSAESPSCRANNLYLRSARGGEGEQVRSSGLWRHVVMCMRDVFKCLEELTEMKRVFYDYDGVVRALEVRLCVSSRTVASLVDSLTMPRSSGQSYYSSTSGSSFSAKHERTDDQRLFVLLNAGPLTDFLDGLLRSSRAALRRHQLARHNSEKTSEHTADSSASAGVAEPGVEEQSASSAGASPLPPSSAYSSTRSLPPSSASLPLSVVERMLEAGGPSARLLVQRLNMLLLRSRTFASAAHLITALKAMVVEEERSLLDIARFLGGTDQHGASTCRLLSKTEQQCSCGAWHGCAAGDVLGGGVERMCAMIRDAADCRTDPTVTLPGAREVRRIHAHCRWPVLESFAALQECDVWAGCNLVSSAEFGSATGMRAGTWQRQSAATEFSAFDSICGWGSLRAPYFVFIEHLTRAVGSPILACKALASMCAKGLVFSCMYELVHGWCLEVMNLEKRALRTLHTIGLVGGGNAMPFRPPASLARQRNARKSLRGAKPRLKRAITAAAPSRRRTDELKSFMEGSNELTRALTRSAVDGSHPSDDQDQEDGVSVGEEPQWTFSLLCCNPSTQDLAARLPVPTAALAGSVHKFAGAGPLYIFRRVALRMLLNDKCRLFLPALRQGVALSIDVHQLNCMFVVCQGSLDRFLHAISYLRDSRRRFYTVDAFTHAVLSFVLMWERNRDALMLNFFHPVACSRLFQAKVLHYDALRAPDTVEVVISMPDAKQESSAQDNMRPGVSPPSSPAMSPLSVVSSTEHSGLDWMCLYPLHASLCVPAPSMRVWHVNDLMHHVLSAPDMVSHLWCLENAGVTLPHWSMLRQCIDERHKMIRTHSGGARGYAQTNEEEEEQQQDSGSQDSEMVRLFGFDPDAGEVPTVAAPGLNGTMANDICDYRDVRFLAPYMRAVAKLQRKLVERAPTGRDRSTTANTLQTPKQERKALQDQLTEHAQRLWAMLTVMHKQCVRKDGVCTCERVSPLELKLLLESGSMALDSLMVAQTQQPTGYGSSSGGGGSMGLSRASSRVSYGAGLVRSDSMGSRATVNAEQNGTRGARWWMTPEEVIRMLGKLARRTLKSLGGGGRSGGSELSSSGSERKNNANAEVHAVVVAGSMPESSVEPLSQQVRRVQSSVNKGVAGGTEDSTKVPGQCLWFGVWESFSDMLWAAHKRRWSVWPKFGRLALVKEE